MSQTLKQHTKKNLFKKCLVMGILNITPDSFSDGGKYFNAEDAIKHAKELIQQGVDIIDVGGESTRPGASHVTETEELERVIPVIKALNKLFVTSAHGHVGTRAQKEVLISIDTYKSQVAKEAFLAGAKMINDISGLTMDENMVKTAGEAGCRLVVMHNKGIPATKPDAGNRKQEVGGEMNHASCVMPLASIIQEVYEWLKKQTDYAIKNGVKQENIIIDPGIGFGKTPKEDLYLLDNLKEFKSLGFPILIGPSRKSFIKKLFGEAPLEKKSKEMIDLAVKHGADIVRIH